MNIDYSRIRRQKHGSIIVLISFGMIAFFAFAALSLDIAHLYQEQRDIQSATDASALAASALITNPPAADSTIIQEAVNLAAANGLSASEIAASNIGTIELGQWSGTAFTAGTKPYNAVLVPAKRTVGLFFAPLMGVSQKATSLHSVAVNGNKTDSFGGNGAGVIPFGLDVSMLDQAVGSTVTIDKGNSGGGSGNFGQLDLSSYSKNSSWSADMYPGCDCTLAIGDEVGTIPGKNGNCGECTPTGFTDRLASNPYAIMPVIGSWGGTGANDVIVGFVGVKIISVTGPGTWSVTFQIVSVDVGGGTGGVATNTAYIARELVQ